MKDSIFYKGCEIRWIKGYYHLPFGNKKFRNPDKAKSQIDTMRNLESKMIDP